MGTVRDSDEPERMFNRLLFISVRRKNPPCLKCACPVLLDWTRGHTCVIAWIMLAGDDVHARVRGGGWCES